MITLLNETKFDIDAFLKKEKITLYQFAKMSKTPMSTLYSAKDGRRRLKEIDFNQIMVNYKEAKKKNQE